MNKKQQIIEWFELSKDNIFIHVEDFRQCRDVGLEHINRLSIKEDYLYMSWIIDFIIEVNDVSLSSLDYLIKLSLGHSLINKTPLEDNYNKLKNMLIQKNKELENSFDKNIDKFGWVYLAMKLEEKKNKIRSYLKNRVNLNYEDIKHILMGIAGYCILAMIYLQKNNKIL